jgi:hypothetical protein
MPIKTPLTAVALALGFAGGATLPALAQEAPMDAPAIEAETGGYTDAQLEAFVAAALAVSEIQQEAAAQLMETPDEAEQTAVLEQANADMVDAIEQAPGITVPEYIEIAEAAEADPTLRAAIEERLVAAQMQ